MFSSTPYQAKVPSDLPASALNRISEVVETQFGYCKQLGKYISTALQVRSGDILHMSERFQQIARLLLGSLKLFHCNNEHFL